MTCDEPVISLRNVTKKYASPSGPARPVLRGLDLDVWRGQFVAIHGDSGSGKSTLLRIIGLVDDDYSGEYLLNGRAVRKNGLVMPRSEQEELRTESVGFIFQEDRLFEHLDVRSNLELPLKIHGLEGDGYRRELERLVEKVYRPDELDDRRLLTSYRSTLSGGQRQRAAILRALAHSPLFLLADEPTASLDDQLKQEVFEILHELASKEGKTIVTVSHEQIFRDAPIVYELHDGKLLTAGRSVKVAMNGARSTAGAVEGADTADEPGDGGPAATEASTEPQWLLAFASWLRSLQPRTPLELQLSLAWRDLFRGWLFTLLALGALTTGAFQLTLLWSLEAGTQELLDDLIRKGSRLNRVSVGIRPEHLMSRERFPDREAMAAIPGVLSTVARREGIYRVNDRRGRDRFETIFGLEPDDPELDKLLFTAGQSFSTEDALEVIMSERSIQRLFDVEGDSVAEEFRQDLIGKRILFAVARPAPGTTLDSLPSEATMEVAPFTMTIAGIVAQAEADRNFYFPGLTQLIFERWRLDEKRSFRLPLAESGEAWSLPLEELRQQTEFAWEEKLHIYFEEIDQVIHGHKELTALGYEARAPIFQYLWVVHTRHLAHLVISGLIALMLLVAGLVIAGNIMIGVQMRLKEIVLLKLLGMRDGDISMIYIWNSVMAALIGTVLGFLAGSVTVAYLVDFVTENYPSAEFSKLLSPTAPFFGRVVMLGLALALVFSVFPAYRAGRTDPVKGFGV